MATRKTPAVDEVQPKILSKTDEIDHAIAKLQRRIKEIEEIDFAAAVHDHTGLADAARDNLRSAILEIYGPHSPEYRAHQYPALTR